MVIAFGRPYRFPGFCGNQHIRDPTCQNPFINRLGNRSRSCFVGFRCFGNTSCSFNVALICMHLPSFWFSCACIFLSFCIHFLSCSFHYPFICIHSFPFLVLSYSFHFHSNVHSCPFIFLSFTCMFLSFCINVLSFPF